MTRYLRVVNDGVFDGLQGGADVLHHGCGNAGQEAGLASGDHGVELFSQIHGNIGRTQAQTRAWREKGRDGQAVGSGDDPHESY